MEEQNVLFKAIREAEESRELLKECEDIAGLSVLPIGATNTQKRKFLSIRSRVIDYHNIVESFLNSFIAEYFVANLNFSRFNELILPNISFEEKKEIVRKLKPSTLTKKDYETINAIGVIRNALAHGVPINNKKYLYRRNEKQHIINNHEAINEVFKDTLSIIKSLSVAITNLERRKTLSLGDRIANLKVR